MAEPQGEKKFDKKPDKKFEKKPGATAAPVGTPGGTLAEVIVACIVLIIVLPLLGLLSVKMPGSWLANGFYTLIGWLKTIATLISMGALLIATYSFIRIFELSTDETKKLGLALNWHAERKQKNVRWERIEQYMTSLSKSDWKIAILEADNILDEVVERLGYKGETLGERMKNIEASDFPYLDDAWTAHKTRNAIAHRGTEYELNRSEAEQTINIYHRIFKELGYL